MPQRPTCHRSRDRCDLTTPVSKWRPSILSVARGIGKVGYQTTPGSSATEEITCILLQADRPWWRLWSKGRSQTDKEYLIRKEPGGGSNPSIGSSSEDMRPA